MVASVAFLLAAAVASADDPKKPAAVGASKPAAAPGTTAKAKPAAVQASSAKATVATHLKVVDASVKLVERKKGNVTYLAASKIYDTHLIVKGHGIRGEFVGSGQKKPDNTTNYDGHTAFQILVEQGYFKYENGIGFIPTEKYAELRDISSGGSSTQDSNQQEGQGQKPSILGASDLNLTPAKNEKMVDPKTPESVVEHPSQKGGIFGYGFDGPLDTYNPNDPNTPEGKRKLLRDQLSELSRACWDGKVSQDKVEECRRNCKAVFEQSKPEVCRETDAVQAQLDQLGDE